MILPNGQKPNSHLLACCRLPKFHRSCHYFGKPIQVCCTDIYENQSVSRFFLGSTITARAIIVVDTISCEHVRIAIPLVE